MLAHLIISLSGFFVVDGTQKIPLQKNDFMVAKTAANYHEYKEPIPVEYEKTIIKGKSYAKLQAIYPKRKPIIVRVCEKTFMVTYSQQIGGDTVYGTVALRTLENFDDFANGFNFDFGYYYEKMFAENDYFVAYSITPMYQFDDCIGVRIGLSHALGKKHDTTIDYVGTYRKIVEYIQELGFVCEGFEVPNYLPEIPENELTYLLNEYPPLPIVKLWV
jgi:hypothetical protein